MDAPARIETVHGDTVRVVLAGTVVPVRHDEVLPQAERAMKAVTDAHHDDIAVLVLRAQPVPSTGGETS
jgi:hypothetical protein